MGHFAKCLLKVKYKASTGSKYKKLTEKYETPTGRLAQAGLKISLLTMALVA